MANPLLAELPRIGLLFLFTFLLCNFTTKSVAIAFNAKTKRFSTRLLHYKSIVPNPTSSDYAALAMRSSARLAYIKEKAANRVSVLNKTSDETLAVSVHNDTVRADLITTASQNVFFVPISIGTPPIPQIAVMDTGSSLFWVQCQPCKDCKKTPDPIYDPSKSSSYFRSSCDRDYCNKLIGGYCDEETGECVYNVTYGGEATSTGVLGYEDLKFETSHDGVATVPSVIFGCGRNNHEPNPIPQSSGIFGISPDSTSIIRSPAFKNSPRYSYCLGNYSDPKYLDSMLVLGNESIFLGQETSIEINNGLLYVSLEGLRVGDTELHIKKDEYNFNVLVDSGTTLSFFNRDTYDFIKGEFKKILDTYLINLFAGDRLCYAGNFRTDVRDFPIVTLRLADGASMVLELENVFIQVQENFCLSMYVRDDNGPPIIGMLAQQFFNIGFDLDTKKMYFRNLDCRLLNTIG